jgi:hypothetical protein
MGLIGRVFGAGAAVKDVGEAVSGVAEVFVGNQAQRDLATQAKYVEAITQFGAEFQPGAARFDSFMNGLNRLPRPLLTMGTLALFVYAMVAPLGFSRRMEGLQLVPEPLWWLLGAIVSFYFGARELHYQRVRSTLAAPRAVLAAIRGAEDAPEAAEVPADPTPAPAVARRPEPTPEHAPEPARPSPVATARKVETAIKVRAADPGFNAAIEEWRAART